jgi:hypothetical protein
MLNSFSFGMKPKFFNQELHNYCLKSTNESIKKMIENYEKERKKQQYKLILYDDDYPSKPNNSIIIVAFFLSIIGFLNYFNNSKK